MEAPWKPTAMPDNGFEQAESSWDFSAAEGTARIAPEAARSGTKGLRIESRHDDKNAFILGPKLQVDPESAYRLTWQARVVSGAGTNIYLRFLGPDGAELSREEGRIGTGKPSEWNPGFVNGMPPMRAVSLQVLIQRPGFRSPNYVIDVDDLELLKRPIVIAAPWRATYKLRPEDKNQLTAADVVGPDGLVYPDFTYAGLPGGIPKLPVAARMADLGVRDGDSIAALLEQTAARVAAEGGGAIELGEGTFYLDEPVMVFGNKVAIRGAGREKTRLIFRYHVPYGNVRFFRLKEGQQIDQGTSIEFHANPRDLVAMELKAGDKSLSRKVRADHWGNTFALRISGNQVLGLLGEGEHGLTAIAEYQNGDRAEATIRLRLTKGFSGEPSPDQLGAINFVGRGQVSSPKPLVADGRRGDQVIRLADGHGFKPGDKISLVAPASDRWKNLVGHHSHWKIQAQNLYQIDSVTGGKLTLNQPLRVEFLVEDGSYVVKFTTLNMGGIENLHLEQMVVPGQPAPGPRIGHTLWHAIDDLWTTGVNTQNVWGFWMHDVTVRNVGRNSAYFLMSKHIEVRNCLFDEAIFKGGGGTGYIGFDRTWDSLMDTVEVRGMRHAPNLQWNSSGNVIRNGRFLGSDGQWHAGWTHENLLENNFIDARGGDGSYGHGLYASGPWSGIHGPQGPRNVVYGNDVMARKDCLHMLGGNEAWMILHNRFVSENGRAVYAREKSFDHIIRGNVFVLRKAVKPAVLLGADSVGVELFHNTFFGVTAPLVEFAGGRTHLLRDEGNTLASDVPSTLPDRPQPAEPSIFQWQRDHAPAIRAAAATRISNPTTEQKPNPN
ncbi:MAG: hypothetical protein SFU85_00370 [Candidatus Methylacidiphilales bacterium]|nr:hypothetical protein [Candidatus Methylacidiphilales bacterium]